MSIEILPAILAQCLFNSKFRKSQRQQDLGRGNGLSMFVVVVVELEEDAEGLPAKPHSNSRTSYPRFPLAQSLTCALASFGFINTKEYILPQFHAMLLRMCQAFSNIYRLCVLHVLRATCSATFQVVQLPRHHPHVPVTCGIANHFILTDTHCHYEDLRSPQSLFRRWFLR